MIRLNFPKARLFLSACLAALAVAAYIANPFTYFRQAIATEPVLLDWGNGTQNVQQTCSISPSSGGQDLNQVFKLKNYGTETATGVVVEIAESADFGTSPSGFLSMSQGTAASPSQSVPYSYYYNWSVGSIPAGAVVTFTVSAFVPAGKSYQVRATTQPLPGGATASNGVGPNSSVGCGTNAQANPGTGTATGTGTGTGTGGGSQSFSLDCSPLTRSVIAGSSAAYDITMTPEGTFNERVTLLAEGVPSPATYSFVPNNLVGGAFPRSRIASISNTREVVPATYTIHFVGRSDSGESHQAECNLEVRAVNRSLTGTVTGSGTGTITASPPGNPALTACASSCTSSFPAGQSVTLTTAAAAGSTFDGWVGGPCSGTSTCTVTMNVDISAVAKFSTNGATGTGSGTGTTTGPSSGSGSGSGSASGTGGGTAGGSGTATTSGSGGVAIPPRPTNITIDTNACSRATISWLAPAGVVGGYNVYRSIDHSSWQKLTAGPLSNSTTSYTDTTATAGSSYYYAVTAVHAAGESGKAEPGITPVNIRPCQPDLSTSDKDIMTINGKNNIINGHLSISCSNATDEVRAVTGFHEGDIVKFSVNICNTGTLVARNLSFIDTLADLSEPSTGWQARYNGIPVTPVVSGTAPNQVLAFSSLGDIPAPTALDTVEFRVLTFEAVVTSPRPGSIGQYRFQNQGNILMDGTPAKHVQTPPYLFNAGPTIPNRFEDRP